MEWNIVCSMACTTKWWWWWWWFFFRRKCSIVVNEYVYVLTCFTWWQRTWLRQPRTAAAHWKGDPTRWHVAAAAAAAARPRFRFSPPNFWLRILSRLHREIAAPRAVGPRRRKWRSQCCGAHSMLGRFLVHQFLNFLNGVPNRFYCEAGAWAGCII